MQSIGAAILTSIFTGDPTAGLAVGVVDLIAKAMQKDKDGKYIYSSK